MRMIDIPGIESKRPTLNIEKSSDFVSGVVGKFAKIHSDSNLGIRCPEAKSSDYHNKAINTLPKKHREKIKNNLIKEISKPISTVSRFVMALHQAFDQHLNFSIAPEIIMMIISQEIAQYVKLNSNNKIIAGLFTKDPDKKQNINVEINDFVYGEENPWMTGISQFKNQLIETVPSDILTLMMPKFSDEVMDSTTSSQEIEISQLISFMDTASKFYEYSMTTLCGIPSFKIEGTPDDWDRIVKSVIGLQDLLPGLNLYFDNLIPILREIRNTADGNKIDKDFWSSIYKENNSSGGPYSNGWFNNFYAYLHGRDWKTKEIIVELKSKDVNKSLYGTKLNNFPSNVSSVPFTWRYHDKEIPMMMVSGITTVTCEFGYMRPKLGVMIVEK